MMNFKLFLEQAMNTGDGVVHFDWAKNAYDDKKTKRLELKALWPSKGGDVKAMIRAFLDTQEAKEADEIFMKSPSADVKAMLHAVGFEGEGTMRLVKGGVKTVDALGS